MFLETIKDNQYKNLVDYIYLRRVLKFSTKGLVSLFKNPSMEIKNFKDFKKERIKNFLFMGKQVKLDTDIQMEKYLIFIKGTILDKDMKSYSICGTRNPTHDGIEKTKKIASFFAEKGYTLINGFAKGIDIQSFNGVLKKNGRYIGVLASGIENVYPPENQKYIALVIKNGALISQRMINKRVNRIALQMRNRFSAQLSLGSIFIEGNYKSGTKWQYKFAEEANKPVFYLEPLDWKHENAHVPRMIKDQGGFEIKNDLSNLEEIESIFLKQYSKKVQNLHETK